MQTETIEYRDGAVSLRGFVAYDDTRSDPRPGVLVMPGGFGLGANAKRRAEMLADLGYVALAGDPYGDGVEFDDLEQVMRRVSALRDDTDGFRQRVRVALETLASPAPGRCGTAGGHRLLPGRNVCPGAGPPACGRTRRWRPRRRRSARA